MISVLITGDQDLFREGLRMLLEAEPDLRVAGEAGDGIQAVTEVRRLDPDVVLMDVRMPRADGIQATAQLVRHGCRARILMLIAFDLDEYVYHAIKAGPAASCSKTPAASSWPRPSGPWRPATPCSPRRSPSGSSKASAAAPPPGAAITGVRLSERELEVVHLVAQGLSNAEIAAGLCLSEATVKSHVAHILARLSLRDRVQIAIFAYEKGIVRAGRGQPGPGTRAVQQKITWTGLPEALTSAHPGPDASHRPATTSVRANVYAPGKTTTLRLLLDLMAPHERHRYDQRPRLRWEPCTNPWQSADANRLSTAHRFPNRL